MTVAGLTQTIAEMKVYTALSGFRDDDLPLFRHKLDFLAHANSSETKERNFQRVIDVAGLPDFLADSGTLNIERFLQMRDSSETREFRDWLTGIGQASEAEIRERTAGIES